jgi:hypothetical protein
MPVMVVLQLRRQGALDLPGRRLLGPAGGRSRPFPLGAFPAVLLSEAGADPATAGDPPCPASRSRCLLSGGGHDDLRASHLGSAQQWQATLPQPALIRCWQARLVQSSAAAELSANIAQSAIQLLLVWIDAPTKGS